jgi:hypothetical protein
VSGFLALWDASDEYHMSAVRLQRELARKRRRFLTDYLVDETVTLLIMLHSHSATDFLDTIERSETPQLEWIGPERFTRPSLCSGSTATNSGHSQTASASLSCANCPFVTHFPPIITSSRPDSFRS